jgi:uncharacterized protein DUF5367
MRYRVVRIGVLLWIVGTFAIRLGGRGLLHVNRPVATLILYLASFVLMALLVPRIFRRLGLEQGSWPAAATLLMLPTLILDPFSCAFFTVIFPNVEPSAAGVFGGWILIFCAGAVAGVWLKPGVRSAVRAGDQL